MNLPFLRKKRPERHMLGSHGERIAERYLQKKGFRILDRNYQNRIGYRLGEIDLVAERDGAIVFVEVKTREGAPKTTFPEDNLTRGKFKKLEKIAQVYLREQDRLDTPYHFDAIAITLETGKNTAHVKHFEYIF